MPESLDPGWVNHHFAWVRNAEGIDRLQQRASFALLPYKGDLSIDDPSSPYYTVRPGGEPLRQAVISILTADLGGELLPGEPSAFDRRVKVDGVVVEISVLDSGNYVYLGFERGTGSLALMQRVAARVDAALATGKWDHAFAEVTDDGREQD